MLVPERLWTVTLRDERNMREWRDPKFEVGGSKFPKSRTSNLELCPSHSSCPRYLLSADGTDMRFPNFCGQPCVQKASRLRKGSYRETCDLFASKVGIVSR